MRGTQEKRSFTRKTLRKNAREWIFGAESEMKMLFCKTKSEREVWTKGVLFWKWCNLKCNQYGTKPIRLIPSNEVERIRKSPSAILEYL